MTKTDGFDHEREGMTLYTLEWNATLQLQATGWKAGWRGYQVLAAEPNALAAAVEGLRVSRVVKGGTATLQGKSEFQKADRGWRVVQSEVTTFKVAAPSPARHAFCTGLDQRGVVRQSLEVQSAESRATGDHPRFRHD